MAKRRRGSTANKRERSWNSYVLPTRDRSRSPVRLPPPPEVPPHLLGFWSLYHYDITTHKAKYVGWLHFLVAPKLLVPKLHHVVGTYHDLLKPEDHDIAQLTPRSDMGWRLWENDVQRYSVVYTTNDDDGTPLLEMLLQGIRMNVVGKRIPQMSERREEIELTDAEWSRFLGMDVAIKLVREEKPDKTEKCAQRQGEKRQPKHDETQSEQLPGQQVQVQQEKREDKPDEKKSIPPTEPKAMGNNSPNPIKRVKGDDQPEEPKLRNIPAIASGSPKSAFTQKRPRDPSPKEPCSPSPRPKRLRESSPTLKRATEPKSPPRRPRECSQPPTNQETPPSAVTSKPKKQPKLTPQALRKRLCESFPARTKRPCISSPAPPSPTPPTSELPTLCRANASGPVPTPSDIGAADALLTEPSHTLLTPSRTCDSSSAIQRTPCTLIPSPALHSERTDLLEEMTRNNTREERILAEKKKHLGYLREHVKLDSEIRKLVLEVEEADKVEEESARRRLELKKQNLQVKLQMIEVDKLRMAAQREGRAWAARVREVL